LGEGRNRSPSSRAIAGGPGLKVQHFMLVLGNPCGGPPGRSASAPDAAARLQSHACRAAGTANTRRRTIVTYFTANEVQDERALEMDAKILPIA